jgi:hypothetical protein
MIDFLSLEKYFLRTYAAELLSPKRRRGWGTFGEAMFQTWWLIMNPVLGIAVSLGIVLAKSSDDIHHFLVVHRVTVSGCAFLVLPVIGF